MLIARLLAFLFLAVKNVLSDCNVALGMQDGRIKDKQITSKKWLYHQGDRNHHYAPHNARLNDTNRSGGWCSEDMLKFPDQHIDVDLLRDTSVTSLVTQGRGAAGTEYVPRLRIAYRRHADDSRTGFRKYMENGKWKVFTANTDSISIVRNTFTVPVIARVIRIYPMDEEFAIHCMRFELHGCKWTNERDTLEEYAAPLGGERQGLSMKDTRYDGLISTTRHSISGGLGRLTDEIYGVEKLSDASGSPWVAYDVARPTLEFQFREKRLFEQVMIHVNNRRNTAGSADDIQIFSRMDAFISADGKEYTLVKSFEPTPRQVHNRRSFSVHVDLSDIVTRHVRLTFTRRAAWLLISEVKFFSYPPTGPFRTHAPTTPKQQPGGGPVNGGEDRGLVVVGDASEREDDQTAVVDPGEETRSDPLSFPIILTIALVGVALTVTVVVMVIRRYRSWFFSKAPSHSSSGASQDMAPPINAEYQSKQDMALLAQQQNGHRMPVVTSVPPNEYSNGHSNLLPNGRFVQSGYSSGSAHSSALT